MCLCLVLGPRLLQVLLLDGAERRLGPAAGGARGGGASGAHLYSRVRLLRLAKASLILKTMIPSCQSPLKPPRRRPP